MRIAEDLKLPISHEEKPADQSAHVHPSFPVSLKSIADRKRPLEPSTTYRPQGCFMQLESWKLSEEQMNRGK